jgi:AraC-like DNA-binding protein
MNIDSIASLKLPDASTRPAKPLDPENDRRLLDDRITGFLSQIRNLVRDQQSSAEQRIDRLNVLLNLPSLHCAVLVPVSLDVSRRIANRGGLAPWQILRVKKFIAEKLASSLRCADMARIACLSPHHFCRAFRVSLKVTPHAYVIRKRLQKARVLIETTRASLGEIAIECGFADQAHFNRIFRKHLGATPGAWRRMQTPANVEGACVRALQRSVDLHIV